MGVQVQNKSEKSHKKNIEGKTIINHPIFDGLYHLFMVIWGMVYYCFNHINQEKRLKRRHAPKDSYHFLSAW